MGVVGRRFLTKQEAIKSGRKKEESS